MRVKNIIVVVALIAAARLLVLGGPILPESAVAISPSNFCDNNVCWDKVLPTDYMDDYGTEPLAPVGNLVRPTFVDIDADGDQDLFMGTFPSPTYCLPGVSGRITFYKNIGTPRNTQWLFITHDYIGIHLGCAARPIPTFIDIDADDDQDLFIGNSDGRIIFYRNIGTPKNPLWPPPNGAQKTADYDPNYAGIDVGANNAPAFADLDDDGDYDLLVGGSPPAGGQAEIFFYKNTGTIYNAQWDPARIYSDVNIKFKFKTTVWPVPVFVDVDADGDQDLFIGVNSAAS